MKLQLHAHLFPSEMRILILNYAMLQSRGSEMITDIVIQTEIVQSINRTKSENDPFCPIVPEINTFEY